MVAISLGSARLSIGIEVRILEGSIDINFVEALRDNLLSPRTQVCEKKALIFWNFCYRRRRKSKRGWNTRSITLPCIVIFLTWT
ncbi:hypothetical protein Ancab_008448 [Ancistrocladus abbreviatus]